MLLDNRESDTVPDTEGSQELKCRMYGCVPAVVAVRQKTGGDGNIRPAGHCIREREAKRNKAHGSRRSLDRRRAVPLANP